MSVFKSLPDELKPREKMALRGTARGMAAEDLVAILLKTGAPGCDVCETAKRLLCAFHGVGELVRQDWKGLMTRIAAYNKTAERKIRGVGPVKCMGLAAAFELVRMAYEAKAAEDLPEVIEGAEDAEKWFRSVLRFGDDREHFWVLALDAAHKPLSAPICVSSGLLNGTPAGSREVFAQAVQWQAAAVIVAHNHPSGDATPSEGDFRLTDELVAAGQVLRIPVLDHLVLGRDAFTSIREVGKMGGVA